jgi:eukaryotic-like serine/threonine-protein kinase
VRASPLQQPELEAALLGDIGFALHLAGRNDEAAEHYAVALQRVRDMNRGEGHVARRMLSNWANASNGTGNFARGLAPYEELMRIEERLNADKVPGAPTLANHAFVLEQLGRYDAALAEYDLAGRAAERSAELAGRAYALVGQASVLAQTGRGEEAAKALDQATRLTPQGLPTHPVNVRARLVRGQIEAANGAPDAAAGHFTAVIEALRAKGVTHGVMTSAYRQRAEVALRQGDLARARADAQQALDISRRLQGREAWSSYTGLAALTLGRVERAEGHIDLARSTFRSAEENLRNALGAGHPGAELARSLANETN